MLRWFCVITTILSKENTLVVHIDVSVKSAKPVLVPYCKGHLETNEMTLSWSSTLTQCKNLSPFPYTFIIGLIKQNN